jgi:hypothetical protein
MVSIQALSVYPMPYAIGISITLFVIAGLFCRFANGKTALLNANGEVLRISMADLPLNLEDTRKELWSSFADNAKSHANQTVSVGLAMVALVFGSNIFSEVLIVTIIIWLVISALLGLLFWLLLRSAYWSIWADTAMLLSLEQIVDNFNDCNLECGYYHKGEMAPFSAILHIAIKQKLITLKTKNSLSFSLLFRKMVIKTGNMTNRNSEKCARRKK